MGEAPARRAGAAAAPPPNDTPLGVILFGRARAGWALHMAGPGPAGHFKANGEAFSLSRGGGGGEPHLFAEERAHVMAHLITIHMTYTTRPASPLSRPSDRPSGPHPRPPAEIDVAAQRLL